MAEYIEREAAIEILNIAYPLGMDEAAYDTMHSMISKLPAADVVEVRHGRWIDRGTADNGDTIGMCSACRRTFRGMKEIGSVGRFCPHCGAKMDGGADDA